MLWRQKILNWTVTVLKYIVFWSFHTLKKMVTVWSQLKTDHKCSNTYDNFIIIVFKCENKANELMFLRFLLKFFPQHLK